MAEKLPATQRWRKLPGQWNPSEEFRCGQGGRFGVTCPKFMPCTGVLNQGEKQDKTNVDLFSVSLLCF